MVRQKQKKKPKKSTKKVKVVKSRIALATVATTTHYGDDDVDTAEYVPVISELQTSIRIKLTGNVPDHFKVFL